MCARDEFHSGEDHHVILNNVDDAVPDYIMQSTTPNALKASFTKKWPDIMAHLQPAIYRSFSSAYEIQTNRPHVILNNEDGAAPDYIMQSKTLGSRVCRGRAI